MAESSEKEELIIAPVPALVAVLMHLEQEKGSPLTEAEVLTARDNEACIAMPRSAYQAVSDARGYADIDPERPWAEWLAFRAAQSGGEA